MKTMYLNGVSVAAVALSLMSMAAAQAQTSGGEAVETVIVTGTSQARTEMNTPLVAVSISSDRIQKLQASSNADILSSVPALKTEGGGGEVANNIFVAGLPAGGQYQFTPLEFNGMPVLGTMGLNSSTPDIFQRPDLGVDRLEFVRGGVSNLFGSGGIGGVINYIDKTGGDTNHGVAQLELADQQRVRADVAVNGPIANNLFYALSGFYRYDNGPIDTGFPTKGYQIRGNLRREFDSGYVTIYFQAIDDQDQFYGDYPLSPTNYVPVAGNNGKKIYTTETSALDNLSFQTPNGVFRSSVQDGASVKGGAVGADFKKEFADGWAMNGKVSIASYRHTFALFSGGDNITNLPVGQAQFMQQYGYTPVSAGGTYNGTFTFANTGATVPSNYLLWGDRVTDRNRPTSTMSGEFNITKDVTSGDWKHHFTLGGFFSQTSARDNDITSSYVGDFDSSPQLVNLTVTNVLTNTQTIVARNGMVDAGTGYTNNYVDARRYAGYFADQMEWGRLILDIGGRYETEVGDVRKEQSSTVTTDTTPNLSSRLAQVVWGNGAYLSGRVSPSAWALAGGALYRVSDDLSVFLNASRGFFMPELRTVVIDTNDDVQSFKAEIIQQVQGGVKYNNGRITASLTGFYTNLSNRRNVNLINGPTPGSPPDEVVNMISTESYGTEATFNYMITEALSFESNFTYEHDEYTQYTPVAACTSCVGNWLQRQPDIMFNAGLYYDDGMFDGAFFDTYTGRTYTSDLNNIELPGYHIVRLDAGYTMDLGQGEKARLGFDVYNLFNSQAATEGSPRQGTLQSTGQAYFIGRDVLPRRLMMRLSYRY